MNTVLLTFKHCFFLCVRVGELYAFVFPSSRPNCTLSFFQNGFFVFRIIVITYKEYFDEFFKEQPPKVKDKIIKVLDIIEQNEH